MYSHEVSESIRTCQECHGGKYDMPFLFPLKKQPIMLVSAMPTADAMYRPLYAIRFFREVCLALFGYGHLGEQAECEKYVLEFCDGSIYWTHYRKCYDPSLDALSNLDDYCAQKHLADEVAVLQPKIIIIVGDEPIRNKIKRSAKCDGAQIVERRFPDGQNTPEFTDVRALIAPYLTHVKASPGSSAGPERHQGLKTTPAGLPASLSFELSALKIALGWQSIDEADCTVESFWYRNLVVPNMRRCFELVSLFSSLEGHGGVLLSEIAGRGWNELQRRSAENPQGGYARARQWYKVFADYVKENCRELAPRADQMAMQLEGLRKVRNAIVHAGGQFSSARTQDTRQRLRGVYSLQGAVFVSEQGEETLKRLAHEATDLLVNVAKHKNRNGRHAPDGR